MNKLVRAFTLLALLVSGLNMSVPDPCLLNPHSGHQEIEASSGLQITDSANPAENEAGESNCPVSLCQHSCRHSLSQASVATRLGEVSLVADSAYFSIQNELTSVQLASIDRPPRA